MIKTVLLGILLLANGAAAKELYRYHDSAGTLVTADTISPLAAADGYQIVNEQGLVLRVIRAQQPINKDSDQSKRDQYLLASFSCVDEITQRKVRKLALLTRDSQNLQNNLNGLVARETALTNQAANSEMAGEPVSLTLVQQIDKAQIDRAEMQQVLADRQHDQGAIAALYSNYELRFRQLKLVKAP